MLGFIRNVACDFRSASTLVYLYKSLILPTLTYCATIWAPHTQIDLSQLISIEHKFLRFASKKTATPMHYFNHDFSNIRKILKLPKLEITLKIQNCIVAYKIANKLFSSSKVNELFVNREITHFLRDPRPVYQPVLRRNYLSESSTNRLKSQWNTLPREIREAPSLNSFKSKISTLFST